MKKQAAFTLIEVMVALFVLAITFIGVLASASYVSRTISVLQEKTFGLWIAQNVVSEISLGLMGKDLDNLNLENDINMAGQKWHWKAAVTSEDKLNRITVNVFANKKDVAQVVFYDPQ